MRESTNGHGATPGVQSTPPRVQPVPDPEAPKGRHAESTGLSGVPHLARRLLDNATTLVEKEIALATSEILHAVHEMKSGVTSLASGAAVLYAGVLFLLLAAVLGLMQVMPGWAAALTVGGIVTIIGIAMLASGKKKVEPKAFTPDRTAESLRKDKQMMGRKIHEH